MRDGGAAKETNKLGPASAASTPALQLQGAMALACALSAKLQRAAAGNPHGTGSLVDLHGTSAKRRTQISGTGSGCPSRPNLGKLIGWTKGGARTLPGGAWFISRRGAPVLWPPQSASSLILYSCNRSSPDSKPSSIASRRNQPRLHVIAQFNRNVR